MVKFDKTTGEGNYLKEVIRLPNKDIFSIAIDGSENKWVGTDGEIRDYEQLAEKATWKVIVTADQDIR